MHVYQNRRIIFCTSVFQNLIGWLAAGKMLQTMQTNGHCCSWLSKLDLSETLREGGHAQK